jgi:hypothetical protein
MGLGGLLPVHAGVGERGRLAVAGSCRDDGAEGVERISPERRGRTRCCASRSTW